MRRFDLRATLHIPLAGFMPIKLPSRPSPAYLLAALFVATNRPSEDQGKEYLLFNSITLDLLKGDEHGPCLPW